MSELNGFRVAVLATDGFEEAELTEPVKALREAGAQVTILSLKPGEIQGTRHDIDKTIKVKVDRTIHGASAEEFDAVHLPGGTVNADSMRMVPEVQAFLRAVQEAGKPISAICHAPWELVSAGLVRGRTLTSYHTIQDDVRNAGGNWVDRGVVEDGNWVTSRQPADLQAFNRAMIHLFGERRVLNRRTTMARTPLNIIARFQAKPGREANLRAILEAMVGPTRAEAGCVNYDLHQFRDDPTRFVLYEGWQSKDALDEHMKTPHFAKMLADLDDVVAERGPDGRPFQADALTMLTDRE